MTNILMLSYDYIDEIKASKDYQRLIWLNKNIEQLYREEIKKFKAKEIEYNDVIAIGTYHPDFKKVSKEFAEIKKNLYEKPEVKEYFTLDKKIELEINNFLNKIVSNISKNIPVQNEFGFFKGGGSCNGC